MIKHADDGASVRYAPEPPVWLADGKNLRGTETADAFELPQMGKLIWERSTHTFKNAGAVKVERNKRVGMQAQFCKFDLSPSKHDLLFERERNSIGGGECVSR